MARTKKRKFANSQRVHGPVEAAGENVPQSPPSLDENGHGNVSALMEAPSAPSHDDEMQQDGQWQTASRTKRRRVENEDGRVKYPKLILHHKSQLKLQLSELQSLVLYTLADGVAPNWVSFKNARHTRKVVVLMVPGLEMGMFDNSTEFPELEKKHLSSTDTFKDFPISLKEQTLSTPLKPLAAVSDHVWSVRAGGDTKPPKFHSAVQSFLRVSLPKEKENKNKKGVKAPKEAKDWRSERTPVTRFIHAASELEETGYPIHPVTYGEDWEAALLERSRRAKTGQNAAGGWVDSKVTSQAEGEVPNENIETGSITAGRTLYAVDCEMVVTSDQQFTLARISVVDWQGKTVLDELVKPSLPVENYHTQYSGMTEELLAPITTTLQDIQGKLLELFTPRTILLGHSLESDLAAMKMTHPFIVDTALIYPHARGLPLRNSLRFLTQKYLSREIQQNPNGGHDSIEDALAVLDLVKLKCEKGPKWGTSEASTESIFRRLGKHKIKDASGKEKAITSAVVDFGAPERGFGRDANVHIAAQNDEEVVEGILRAVKNPPDPATDLEMAGSSSGQGVDFVWARLRDLEKARGWTEPFVEEAAPPDKPSQTPNGQNNPFALPTTTTSTSKTGPGNPFSLLANQDTPESDQQPPTTPPVPTPSSDPAAKPASPPLLSALTATTTLLARLHASLPPLTLLVIYSGTNDARPVLRLQALHAQFRREYKVKKWDELSVRWTDTEEVALREAVGRVREGVGFLGVT